jgi:hypothetical protein
MNLETKRELLKEVKIRFLKYLGEYYPKLTAEDVLLGRERTKSIQGDFTKIFDFTILDFAVNCYRPGLRSDEGFETFMKYAKPHLSKMFKEFFEKK